MELNGVWLGLLRQRLSCHFIGSRSTLYIPALTLPFSSVFFDSFSITLLYSRRKFQKKSPKIESKLK